MNNTIIYWHPDIALHDLEAGHVAMDPYRIATISQEIRTLNLGQVLQAREASREEFERVHAPAYLAKLEATKALEHGEEFAFDNETILNRHTWRALQLSAGAVCQAVDAVLAGETRNAFCAVYAGHHAQPAKGGGFCFTNQVAIGAAHARAKGVPRIAILDFDTHSGNGTILSVFNQSDVLFAETYQKGYPGAFLSGHKPAHILREKANSPQEFANGWNLLFSKVAEFAPNLIFVSAGFDAHKADPLGVAGLSDEHYAQFARKVASFNVPVIAVLEGGYSVPDTARCAGLFIRELADATAHHLGWSTSQ